MSLLPTPPRPVQRDDEKENQALTPKKSIGWAANKEIFEISPSAFQSTKSSNVHRKPRKSILKPSRPLQPFHPEKKRDFTPTPDDVLSDPHFLQYPISIIISSSSSLRDLTEAYNILAARIRSTVPTEFWQAPDPELGCPLFQPLRLNADALATAIKRDLGRILIDPLANEEERSLSRIPTPRPSPKSKSPSKGGMTEGQVKLARDLSTVTASVIKFLVLAFQASSLYSAFSNKQLNTILTSVLSIPLADSIRSPSARKICGFSITLLQSQRLPDEVLNTARDRILFALKRAMEGELGREGKKGSASEAFKAVHDLSLYKPSIFVPGMEHYISSVLEGLLAPSCALRVQAAHALGGLSMAIARSGSEFDDFIRNVSPCVVDFFLRKDNEGSTTTILRTLRTTLRTSEPIHHAQGPLWAISVLASLIVLFGPALLRNYELLTTFRDITTVGIKSKKLAFRTAVTALWGPLIWTWQKWRNTPDINELTECGSEQELEAVKIEFSQLLMKMNHTPIGVLLYGTMLGDSHETCQRMDMLQIFVQLAETVRRHKGELTSAVLAVLERMVNTREDDEFYAGWLKKNQKRLIPQQLFSVSPGLLTTEMNMTVLGPMVENIVMQMSNVDDIRPLAEEERCLKPVFGKALDVWDACLEQLQLCENEPVPDVFIDTWCGIVRMGLSAKDEQRTISLFGEQCAKHLCSIIVNPAIDMRDDPRNDDSLASPTNIIFKFQLVRSLWSTLVSILPSYAQGSAAKPIVRFLVEKQDLFIQRVGDDASEQDEETLSEWSQLIAQVAAGSGSDFTNQFWSLDFDWDDRSRARVWRAYMRGWTEDGRGSWEGATVLLGQPFSDESPWDMSDADLSTWNTLLSYATEGAARSLSHSQFLECLVKSIGRRHIVSLGSTVRVADYLLSAFDKTIDQCTSLPSAFIDLIHDILSTSYPPPPRNKVVAIWLLRSLVSVISNCPSDLVVELLENLLEGLVIWITDDCELFTDEEYTSEIIPLYETIIVSVQSLPPTPGVLQSLATLLASALQIDESTGAIRSEREEALTSFTEFWSTNCRDLLQPRGGWAEGIAHALELAFPPDIAESDHHEHESEDELDILQHTITPRRRLIQSIPLPPPPSPVRFLPAKVAPSNLRRPSAKRGRASEPTRLPALFVDSPPSPTVQKSKRTRSRAASSACKENIAPVSNKRRSGAGEEEEDNDIIFVGMKRSPAKSALGTKRPRILTGGSDDSEDTRAVEAAIQVASGSSSPIRCPFAAASGRANASICTMPPPPPTRTSPSKRARAGTLTASSARTPPAPAHNPSKRRRTSAEVRTSTLSRDRTLSVGDNGSHRECNGEDDDDDWLPPSSDPESEDDPDGDSDMDADMDTPPDLIDDLSSSSGGSSSSPRPPNRYLPRSRSMRAARFDQHAVRVQTGSDDCSAASSPTRKMVRRASAVPPPHSKRVTPLAVRVFRPETTSPLI